MDIHFQFWRLRGLGVRRMGLWWGLLAYRYFLLSVFTWWRESVSSRTY